MSGRPPAAETAPDPAERGVLDLTLPYRPNVGICLFNRAGLVFAGQAFSNPHGWPDPEIVLPGADWILPQGGIDAGEDIAEAARRELWEETGVTAAELVAITDDWWPYDFPVRGAPSHKLFPFRGQRQRWAAFRFTGADDAIAIDAAHTDEPAEFAAWAWLPLERMAAIGPAHRRGNYQRVATAFRDFSATSPLPR